MKRISLKIRLLFVVAGMLLAVIAPSRLLAQAQTAGIVGVVADASGGVVPNAKVTVTSPVLQVPELTTMTDTQGNYKFVELPAPGVYRIKTSSSTPPLFSRVDHYQQAYVPRKRPLVSADELSCSFVVRCRSSELGGSVVLRPHLLANC